MLYGEYFIKLQFQTRVVIFMVAKFPIYMFHAPRGLKRHFKKLRVGEVDPSNSILFFKGKGKKVVFLEGWGGLFHLGPFFLWMMRRYPPQNSFKPCLEL